MPSIAEEGKRDKTGGHRVNNMGDPVLDRRKKPEGRSFCQILREKYRGKRGVFSQPRIPQPPSRGGGKQATQRGKEGSPSSRSLSEGQGCSEK